MKTVTIKSIKDLWNGKLFAIETEDGEEYKVWANEHPTLEVGAQITGRVEDRKSKRGYFETFLVGGKEASGARKKGGREGSVPSFALSYAKDIAVAQIEAGVEVKSENILKLAGEFLGWLNANGAV